MYVWSLTNSQTETRNPLTQIWKMPTSILYNPRGCNEVTMNLSRVLYHLMRADFLERVRSYRFLAMLLFTIFLTYLFIPALDSVQIAGLELGGYRGEYSSAWIGSMVTLLMGEFFILFAFYLLKGSIELDRRTGVGQILASTPMSKATYTLGKWLSNIAVIAAMTGMIVIAAGVLQLIRGEDLSLNLWVLSTPFLFVLLPALVVIAATAVLFDSINLLRGGLGNIIFFFFAYPALILLFDLQGNNLIYPSIYQACAAQFSGCNPNRQIDLGLAPLSNFSAFRYGGIEWTVDLLLGRLALVLLGAVIALFAAALFHRFDPAKSEQGSLGNLWGSLKRAVLSFITAPPQTGDLDEDNPPVMADVAAARLTPLPSQARLRLNQPRSYWQVLVAELRLTFKGVHWLWYVGAIALIGTALLIPDLSADDVQLASADLAQLIILPLAWVWPLTLWSGLGVREARYRVEQMVLSAPFPLRRHLPMTWFVGVLIAFVLSSGVSVQLALAGRWTSLLVLGIGAVFVPTLALAMGCWSNGSKLFEGTYLFAWYLASVHLVPHLDFMGRVPAAIDAGVPWFYAGLTLVLIAAVVLGRRRQIKI
jgi:hypothetical protein